jgi:hypothetical protein
LAVLAFIASMLVFAELLIRNVLAPSRTGRRQPGGLVGLVPTGSDRVAA